MSRSEVRERASCRRHMSPRHACRECHDLPSFSGDCGATGREHIGVELSLIATIAGLLLTVIWAVVHCRR